MEGIRKAQEMMTDEMGKLTGGLRSRADTLTQTVRNCQPARLLPRI